MSTRLIKVVAMNRSNNSTRCPSLSPGLYTHIGRIEIGLDQHWELVVIDDLAGSVVDYRVLRACTL
jgi:hypothetical protein